MYYMMMSTLEDEETQRKGVTFVAYNVAGEDIPSKTDFRTIAAGAWVGRFALLLSTRFSDDTDQTVSPRFLFCR
jgi:hypothetical protein